MRHSVEHSNQCHSRIGACCMRFVILPQQYLLTFQLPEVYGAVKSDVFGTSYGLQLVFPLPLIVTSHNYCVHPTETPTGFIQSGFS
jgi:hypothetical protein